MLLRLKNMANAAPNSSPSRVTKRFATTDTIPALFASRNILYLLFLRQRIIHYQLFLLQQMRYKNTLRVVKGCHSPLLRYDAFKSIESATGVKQSLLASTVQKVFIRFQKKEKSQMAIPKANLPLVVKIPPLSSIDQTQWNLSIYDSIPDAYLPFIRLYNTDSTNLRLTTFRSSAL
jgi:hypothetical protein